ncbi:SPOR domain-containing protein [Pseudomonadota bacterium]
MKKFSNIFLLPSIISIVTIVILTSCQPKAENLRVVNSRGQPVNLEKKVPVFNSQQLEKQKAFKQNNGGITLIDESGPKYFNSRGNNYAYAEKQDSLPESIFADQIKNDKRKIIKKNPDKATIKEVETPITENEVNIQSGNIDSKNRVEYLFPEDKTSPTRKKSQKNNNVVALNQKSKTTTQSSSPYKNDFYYLQLGAFKSKKGAETMLNDYKRISSGEIKEVTINKQKIYRVVLGPYTTKNRAETNKEKVIKTGHYDVFVTKR